MLGSPGLNLYRDTVVVMQDVVEIMVPVVTVHKHTHAHALKLPTH